VQQRFLRFSAGWLLDTWEGGVGVAASTIGAFGAWEQAAMLNVMVAR